MWELDHVTAAGTGLQEAGMQLQRLGFTLSRGDSSNHLRIVLENGYIDLLHEPPEGWHWREFFVKAEEPESAQDTLEAGRFALGKGVLPAGTLPTLLSPATAVRPQDRMEPERAKAVVAHANSAVSLGGLMLVVPDYEPVVGLYEQLLGRRAGAPFADSVLGVEGRDIALQGNQRLSIVTASLGTGAAAGFLSESPTGIFAVIVKVRSLKTAGDALRQGSVYSYRLGGQLGAGNALPGVGAILFEEA